MLCCTRFTNCFVFLLSDDSCWLFCGGPSDSYSLTDEPWAISAALFSYSQSPFCFPLPPPPSPFLWLYSSVIFSKNKNAGWFVCFRLVKNIITLIVHAVQGVMECLVRVKRCFCKVRIYCESSIAKINPLSWGFFLWVLWVSWPSNCDQF